ncbi:vacuole membrane protein 1-like isoform X3 [Varroa jacobsoni]|uniref:vacuole membrane protein 1-like isoform X3 n=1 Tax=Varroa jacobsoni TaxID=62625 RepID=UPI000BF4C95B|nr:vacuole membrane protein 1-like isoform X3 [Varroa jacobsoni]
MDEVVTSNSAPTINGPGRRRRTLAVRGDYLRITKEELRKELRLRGLRTSSKRIEMIRKLEKWEQERREQERREQEDGNPAVQGLKIAVSPSLLASLNSATGGGTGLTSSGTREAAGGSGDVGLLPFDLGGSSESLLLGQMVGLHQGDGRKLARRQNNKVLGGESGSNGDGDGVSVSDGNAGSRSSVELHIERQSLVLWRRPFTTLHYFSREIFDLVKQLFESMYRHKVRVCIVFLLAACMAVLYYADGSHHGYLEPWKKQAIWCIYWIGLGVLSSVGLGTGLHTFVLYLGPHIAAVTLAAHECQSLDFPEPPYPDEIKCPEQLGPAVPGIWAIMSKVRVEAFMWGAGTALGELPPYFMARAAALSGAQDAEDLEAVEEIRALEAADRTQLSWGNRLKLLVDDLIGKVGFFGILACASIPNPLFDVAGIVCGHWGVPFTTFFGATLIGKAIFKMHVQKLFVILACGETHVKLLLNFVRTIPIVGPSVVPVFEVYLEKQKNKLKQVFRLLRYYLQRETRKRERTEVKISIPFERFGARSMSVPRQLLTTFF